MFKSLALLSAVLGLAACGHVAQPAPAPLPAELSQCNPAKTAVLVGTIGATDAQIKQLTGATEVRRLGPNSAATLDFRASRVSVMTDPASQKIIRATCG